MDTKSSKSPRFTLLHYLAQVIDVHFPEMLAFQIEFAPLIPASRISIQSLHKEAHSLMTEIRSLEKQMKQMGMLSAAGAKSAAAAADDDPFPSIMRPFLANAQSTVGSLAEQLEKVQKQYEISLTKYGEDKNEQSGCVSSSETFFDIFKVFLTSFQKALVEYRQFVDKEQVKPAVNQMLKQLADQNRRESVQPQSSTMTANSIVGEESEKGVMDSLLENLKRGNRERPINANTTIMGDVNEDTEAAAVDRSATSTRSCVHDSAEMRKVMSRLRRTDVLSAYASLTPSISTGKYNGGGPRNATATYGRRFSLLSGSGQLSTVSAGAVLSNPAATATMGPECADIE